MDSLLLERLETVLHIGGASTLLVNPHASVSKRARALDQKFDFLMSIPPYWVWFAVLSAFGFAAALVLVNAALDLQLL